MKEIYTIGYGNRGIDKFIELLKQYKIEFLIDVRSSPYSRHSPNFTKDKLEQTLKLHGIRYVFMGDNLGGRPKDEDCYTEDGKVDYEKCKTKDFYTVGIQRLNLAYEKELRVALMCSEAKPENCHRSKLIGETLSEQGLTIRHIDEKGKLKSQAEVINIVISQLDSVTPHQLRLFDSGVDGTLKLTSKGTYHSRSLGEEETNGT